MEIKRGREYASMIIFSFEATNIILLPQSNEYLNVLVFVLPAWLFRRHNGTIHIKQITNNTLNSIFVFFALNTQIFQNYFYFLDHQQKIR